MKFTPIHLALWGLMASLSGQETADPPQNVAEVSLPGPINDGRPMLPAPPPEVPDFEVVASQTRRLDVVEAPPMPGLPPVEGTISLAVRKVEDPLLPELRAPLPPLDRNDPVVIARLAELRSRHPARTWLFLSAAVYDNNRTFLRIYGNGNVDGTVTAWSTINFNHFSGFGGYRVTEADGKVRDVCFLMGIGNMNTARMKQWAAKAGREYVAPEIPVFPDAADGEPAFIVVQGEAGGEAMASLREVHELYRKEGQRMEAAFEAREIAQAEQKAYLLANPPEPKDLMLHYWRGKRPENTGGGR